MKHEKNDACLCEWMCERTDENKQKATTKNEGIAAPTIPRSVAVWYTDVDAPSSCVT
jgi:hypothetical protein